MTSSVSNYDMNNKGHAALANCAARATTHDNTTLCEATKVEVAVEPATITYEAATTASSTNSSCRKRKRSSLFMATAQLKAPSRVIKTRSVAAREEYIRSCKPAQEVFGITELTEAILLKGLTIQKLYQLKRVSRFFKDTIEASIQLRKVMFLEPHCQDDHPNPRAFTSFNPLLLLDDCGLGKIRGLCHPQTPAIPDHMNAEITLGYTPLPEYGSYSEGPSSYVGRWDALGDCVGICSGGGKTAPCATRSWKRMRISAWSVPVHVCVYACLMRSEFIVLPPDSTLYDLICRVYECQGGGGGSKLIQESRGVYMKRLPEWWAARFG
ncbi:hypothetical protein B0A48_00198 [Cryoendolithus antarcticus]|uniref:F-box domain-containing protein n=1 Tax=Cryoendolithus antarcticus TaxID=1507870 RepID=A0A1V8TTX4_9PEZI|nr:hypothetical protein B0A48_00198 [Cryoendolithus antarcticus]